MTCLVIDRSGRRDDVIRSTRPTDAVRRQTPGGVAAASEEFISHSEVIERLKGGGEIRYAVFEEVPPSEFSYPGSIEIRQADAPKKRRGGWTRTSSIAKGQSDA
jgi:hypothetical protein